MPDLPSPLNALRQEIDRIDEAMHRLLMQRGSIIDRLIAVKGTAESGSAFRPGREADMMRMLVERHEGRLPFSAVEHIWRTIIATFTHVQAPYTVHVDGRGDAGPMRDLARFQMGFDVPLAMHSSPEAVIEAVAASAGDLGLIALDRPHESAWWHTLGEPGQPQVMARLPFLIYPERPAGTPALVVAKPLGAAAVTDVTVVAVERPTRLSPVALASFSAHLIAETVERGRWQALIGVEGGAIPDDTLPLGGYAMPLEIFAPSAQAAL